MRVGYFSTNTAGGISPGALGRELEERGFDSLWLPEHSHIPVERAPVPMFGTAVPDAYVHLMDPLWEDEEPEFEGRWDRFTKSWLYPKPIQRPLPVGYGYSGSQGMSLAAQEADEWYPIDGVLTQTAGGVGEGIARFRGLVEKAGRRPEDVPITMFCWGWEPGQPSVENLKEYGDLGVERIVVCPPTMERHGSDVTRRRLDEFMPLV